MGTPLKLMPAWQAIWQVLPTGERAYLGKFVRWLSDRGIAPSEVSQAHFEAWSKTMTGREAAVGHLNSVANKFNLLAFADGTPLPRLALVANKHDRRAADNAALPPMILAEIAKTCAEFGADADDNPHSRTAAAIERRLLEVARHPVLRGRIASFRELADPDIFGAFVLAFEEDPEAVQLTCQVNRTRQLQDVVRALTFNDHEAEADWIEREMQGHPRKSLEPADSTKTKLAAADDPKLDVRRRQAVFDAIAAFYEEQTCS